MLHNCARTLPIRRTVIYLEFQFEQVTSNQMLQIFDVDHFRWFRKQTDGVPFSIPFYIFHSAYTIRISIHQIFVVFYM